jgi:hypothetical protein
MNWYTIMSIFNLNLPYIILYSVSCILEIFMPLLHYVVYHIYLKSQDMVGAGAYTSHNVGPSQWELKLKSFKCIGRKQRRETERFIDGQNLSHDESHMKVSFKMRTKFLIWKMREES